MGSFEDIYIRKEWAMPNSETFKIKAIKDLILKHTSSLLCGSVIVDPFARNMPLSLDFAKFRYITNDLDESFPTDYHKDATEFLESIPDNSVDMVLYDPPYSPRQVAESYTKLGRSVSMSDTQSSYWSKQKNKYLVF